MLSHHHQRGNIVIHVFSSCSGAQQPAGPPAGLWITPRRHTITRTNMVSFWPPHRAHSTMHSGHQYDTPNTHSTRFTPSATQTPAPHCSSSGAETWKQTEEDCIHGLGALNVGHTLLGLLSR